MEYEIIQTPHLPTGKVRHILCGSLPADIHNALLQYTDEIIITDNQPYIEPALQNHADLCACPIGKNKILLADSQRSIKDKLISLGFCVIMQKNIYSPYPNDCCLNFVNTGHYSIMNINIHKQPNICSADGTVISVRQGYVKCSIAPVAENAIITDDPGIAKLCTDNGMDVCYVQKGDIRLNGYNYGFIGGCCGKVHKNLIAFYGNPESHRDCKKIKEFLNKYDITAVSLSDSQLTDIGSLIPLTQEKG